MSSFVGHSLVGGVIAWVAYPSHFGRKAHCMMWASWLTVIALIPDLDYVVPIFHPSANNGLRITHSLLFAIGLPLLTILSLFALGVRKQRLWRLGSQSTLAGLSHIGLDLLVGVTALPLFWPLSDRLFRLPFGLLPSAGKISLFNYYFYYNLVIELGVLVHLMVGTLIHRSRISIQQKWGITFTLLLISTYFMHWAFGLSR